MTEVHGYAAKGAKQNFEPFSYGRGLLGREDIEVEVEYCGLCRSDLSTINDD